MKAKINNVVELSSLDRHAAIFV